jgi:serine phosphatase RsbU (regulator of sigma subunit)/CHASE2 domain-containing sensor protein
MTDLLGALGRLRRFRSPRFAGLAMLFACLAVIALVPAPLGELRSVLFDGYQRLLPRERQYTGAIVVAIDEAALQARGQWPWPRALTAELLDAIGRARPLAIGVDVLFSEPERAPGDGDAVLARAVKATPTVLGVAGLYERDRRFADPPLAVPLHVRDAKNLVLQQFEGHLQSRVEIDRAAAGHGLINADDVAPVIRSVPLLARVGSVTVPALTIEMLRIAQGAGALRVDEAADGRTRLRVGEIDVPLEPDGSAFIHFSPRYADRLVSAEDVLQGKGADRLSDSFVFVGVTGLGLIEWRSSPLGENVPGVEVHAQLLEQLLEKRFLLRPYSARWIEAALLVLAAAVLLACVPKLRAWISTLALVAVLAALAASGLAAFRAGWLLDAATPGIGAVLVFGAMLAATLTEAQRQRQLLRMAQAKAAAELEVAQRIQLGMLPNPRIAFAHETRFRLDARVEPARTVGGDFYDCFMVDRQRLFFVVGDVSGKGLPASLFMALSKSLLKSVALRDADDAGRILSRANTAIARENPESLFTTALAGLLDVETGRLSLSSAGHEPPFVRRRDGTLERLAPSGDPPLCILDNFEYGSAPCVLARGEWLCAVTDGVTEAMNARGELYGSERLEGVLARQRAEASPAAIVTEVRDDVSRFVGANEQSDDLTLLCLLWSGPAAEAGGAL